MATISLSRKIRRYFRDELRAARALALRDPYAFEELVIAFEQLGKYLHAEGHGLGNYEHVIARIAAGTPLAATIPTRWRSLHTPFDVLYDLVRTARNSAVHQGALAGHLIVHATQLAIVLEDALMADGINVSDFMVRQPIRAESWQPLSFLRQTMLEHAFSFLPVYTHWNRQERWWLVPDYSLAAYLRSARNTREKESRLTQTLEDALEKRKLILLEPPIFTPETPISTALEQLDVYPALVTTDGGKELLGILTPFDLL